MSEEALRDGATEGTALLQIAVDQDGPESRLVLTDPTGDERWLSVLYSEAPDLSRWR